MCVRKREARTAPFSYLVIIETTVYIEREREREREQTCTAKALLVLDHLTWV